MSIGKVSFKGIDSTSNIQEVKKEEVNTSTPTEENKEKSNAAKYMIGATALAATIAVGIIGHKNNWWRKAADAADDISKKGAETLDNAEKNTLNISSKTSKASDLANDIDYSDFSKIEGEIYEDNGFKYKDLKNSEGKKIKTFVSGDGKRIVWTIDYNPETDKPIKMIEYRDNGKTVATKAEFDPLTGNTSKAFSYQEDGKTLGSVIDYDPSTGNLLKRTKYQDDGKTVRFITDYEPSTRYRLKETWYQEDGKTVRSIEDYDPTTGNRLKQTFVQQDGKTLNFVIDYEPTTGKKLKTTYYKPDGTVDRVENAL